jgi:hypothetical protein
MGRMFADQTGARRTVAQHAHADEGTAHEGDGSVLGVEPAVALPMKACRAYGPGPAGNQVSRERGKKPAAHRITDQRASASTSSGRSARLIHMYTIRGG